ncbi:3627_t:CDS:2 [Gigaspora rosea]|nr:3627_t:CDS:2 [Gigaspora rosea]
MGRRKRKNKIIEFCTNEECLENCYDQEDCKNTFVTERKKFHRVFGKFQCNECGKNGLAQECKRCQNESNKLVEWRPLIKTKGDSKRPHEAELCEKCQIGAKCQENNYY